MTSVPKFNTNTLCSTILAGSLLVGLAFTSNVLMTNSAEAAPARCKTGYVWREATPSDHICVHPASRAAAARDNAKASSRIKPGGGAYGPFTCKPGFVWRVATGSSDKVCVHSSVRTRSKRENQRHAHNVRPTGFTTIPVNPQLLLPPKPSTTPTPSTATTSGGRGKEDCLRIGALEFCHRR